MEAGRRYDLVIAELTVPGGMGGKEMVARLRAIDPTAVALVSSGYSRDAVVSDHRAYGFAGVLSKPYLLEELAATVHAALGDAGEARRDRA